MPKHHSISFREFVDIAESNSHWFIKPNLIREEFLVYALKNQDRALQKIKSDNDKLFDPVEEKEEK